jgi:hypothetical protein
VDGQEFINYQHEFLRRVDQYYKNKVWHNIPDLILLQLERIQIWNYHLSYGQTIKVKKFTK